MAKRDDEREVETLTENWISINRSDDPVAWEAWRKWRREQLGCVSAPNNFTVPTPFPPATVKAAKEYVAIVQLMRKVNGWNDSRSKINPNVSAWMGA